MNRVNYALTEFREMDELAAQESAIHSLHPLAKLIVTVYYIAVVVSYDRYGLSGLAAMVLYPVAVFQLSGIPVRTCLHKLRVVLPLVCAIGLADPFFDTDILISIGGYGITGGMVSMVTLVMKGVFSLTAAFIFVATTSIDGVCAALRDIHVPGIILTMLMLTYRYIALMLEEAGVMTEAYRLRAPHHRGIHVSAWGPFLGQLLLRSMDRAEEVYRSMQLRGFCDEFRHAGRIHCGGGSVLFMILCLLFITAARRYNIAYFIGNLLI